MGLMDSARKAVAGVRAGVKKLPAAKAPGFAKRLKKNPKKISPVYNAFNSVSE